jgi:hypothetical protein
MNYSSPRSSANVLLVDGVEYDLSNLLIQSMKPDDRSQRSQSLQKEQSSCYIGKITRAKSLMSMNQKKNEYGLKKAPPSHQYSISSRNLKSPLSPSPVREEEEETLRKITKAKSLMSMNQKKKEYGLKKAPPSHQYSISSRNLKSPLPPSPVREEEEEILRARRETYNHATTVEIAPGVHEILRGAVETRQAIQSGAITQVRCCCCTQTVQCIEDAAFFICPTCSVISQVPFGSWGVGLGFVPEPLAVITY